MTFDDVSQKREEQMRLALDVANLGIWDWNLPTGEIIWSEGHERLFGLELGSFDGTVAGFERCVDPADVDRVLGVLEQSRLQHLNFEQEFRVIWPDGSVHWIEGKGKFFYNDHGEAVRMIGTVTEITQRKAKEAQLQLLESVVQFSNDAILITEAEPLDFPDSRILYANPAFTRMKGYSLEEVLGKTPRMLQNQESSQAVLDQIQAALQQSQSIEVELINYRKDGTPFWVELNLFPIKNQTGLYTHWIAIQRDITERKQAETALQEREMMLRSIGDNLPNGAILQVIQELDKSLHFNYISAGIERFTGFKPEDILKNYSLLESQILPEDYSLWQQSLEKASQNLSVIDIEIRKQVTLGEIGWSHIRVAPHRLSDGRVRWDGIIIDITELKNTELALQETQKFIQKISDSIPNILCVFDVLNQANIYLNPKGSDFFGQSITEIQEKGSAFFQEVIHPDDLYKLEELSPRLAQLQDGEIIENELRIKNAAGEWRLLHTWDIVFSRTEEGIPDKIIGNAVDITDIKQLQESLRESEERFRVALENSPITMCNQDLQLRYTWIYNTVNNIDQSLIIGKTDAELKIVDEAQKLTEIKQSVLSTGKGTRTEVSVTLNQQLGYYDLTVEPLRNLQGEIVGITCAAMDITKRKKVEIELRKYQLELEERVQERTAELHALNERLLLILEDQQIIQDMLQEQAQLLDLAHDTIITRNLKNMITFWNHGAEMMYGWTKAEALGQSIHSLLCTQFPEPLIDIEGKFLATGYWEGELIHRKKDGTGMIVLSRWVLQRGKKDIPIKVLEINTDITETKKIQYALEKSEAKFRTLTECAPNGIFLVNHQGDCTYVNPRCQEIAGYTFEEALGQGWQNFIHPEDREMVIANASKFHSTNQEIGDEFRYQHRDGTVRFVRLKMAPILSSLGNIIGHVGSVEDITEKQKIEQMKREFIAVVSHELRTPLTSILGALGLLANGVYDQKPEKAKRMLNIALRETERLVRLVNDILDFERLQSGQVKPLFQECLVSDLLKQSAEAMTALAESHQIRLSMQSCEAWVWATPDAIIQTLTNLISNAIKFSPPQTTIEIEAQLITRDGDVNANLPNQNTLNLCLVPPYVLFRVKDQGRGIPDDKINIIFEQFQQVDASDSRQKGGTGLGLAICRMIIQQHGGEIWVESQLNQGSCFCFTLPLPPN